MTSKTCPKCNTKSEDLIVCTSCGLNFEEYEVAKQEKLGDIRTLLSEGKYVEAKQIAEKLPVQFPDNKTDFVLLLSNINRDISIVEKSNMAYAAYKEGDYKQAAFLLRNIKAFNPALNEKVIGLRRKAERQLQAEETFRSAVAAFDDRKFARAKQLFLEVHGAEHRDEISEYLQKTEQAIREILDEAIGHIRNRQYKIAENTFTKLKKDFPDLSGEIDDYLALLARRIEIKNNIIAAARAAQQDERLLESKVLYSFLGQQFPEFYPLVQPHLEEIGTQAVTSLAETENSGKIDFAFLGLSDTFAGTHTTGTAPEDINTIMPAEPNLPSKPDIACSPVVIDVEGVADFIF